MASDPDKETMKKAQANCQALIQGLLAFCLNLVRFDDPSKPTEPCGLATGFLIAKAGRHYLLSAGHAMRKDAVWFWETNVVFQDERRVLCLPVGPFTLLDQITLHPGANPAVSEVDVAWCEFDLARLQRLFQEDAHLKGQKLEFQFYQRPLDETPILRDEPYTFAAWNRAQLIPLGSLFLKREPACETCMEFVGTGEKGNYVFKLARPHQGHEYYRGSSGAPIAAPDGRIVSMVLGGCPKTNEIYGLPLAPYARLLELTMG